MKKQYKYKIGELVRVLNPIDPRYNIYRVTDRRISKTTNTIRYDVVVSSDVKSQTGFDVIHNEFKENELIKY